MQIDYKRQIWITLGVVLGAALLFIPVFYLTSEAMTKNIQEIVDRRSLIRQGSSLTGTLADLKKEKLDAERYRYVLDNLVASRDEIVVSFSGWVEREAAASQVGTSFSFQGSEVLPTDENFGYAQFVVRLSGDLNDLTSLIKKLEQESKRFLLIFESFDINKAGEGYQISLTGRIFFK